jgi:CBS domain-containing protein
MRTLTNNSSGRTALEARAESAMVAANVMAHDVPAVSPEIPIHLAIRLMLQRRTLGLSVVDADNAVMGQDDAPSCCGATSRSLRRRPLSPGSSS